MKEPSIATYARAMSAFTYRRTMKVAPTTIESGSTGEFYIVHIDDTLEYVYDLEGGICEVNPIIYGS